MEQRRRCAVAAVFAIVMAGSVQAVPVLEWAPTPGGPWQPEPDAAVVQLGDGTFRVLAPAEAAARFYRLMESGTELAHCPLYMRPAVEIGFQPGDLDSDGDTVSDCEDLCPGHDDRIDDNRNGIPDECEVRDMVRIAAGSFAMGDPYDEGGTNERPLHTVPISTFFVDRYEVTKALWDDVSTWALAHGYAFENAGGGKGPDHPVHAVSWYDAVKWCNARSEKEGLTPCYYTSAAHTAVYRAGQVNVPNDWVNWEASGYRLPTEAEWEKAARGGLAERRFPWGDTISHTQANYDSSSSYFYDVSPTRGYHPDYDVAPMPYTSPVGALAQNGFGLYDMAGNVWEWCWDWYDANWYGRPEAAAADPRGPGTGSLRELRGGSWWHRAGNQRCAYRVGDAPGDSHYDYGFRCVRGQL